jgi:hypothetical protein
MARTGHHPRICRVIPGGSLGDHLNRLRQLRVQIDSLFRSLENDASADETRLKHLAMTYDAVGTALTLGAEVGLLVHHALKEGAEGIAKNKLAKEIGGTILKE